MKLYKNAFVYSLLVIVLIGSLFFMAIPSDTVLHAMDLLGWTFFITSCLSHAAILVLILLLLFFLPWALLRMRRLATVLFVGAVSLLVMVALINLQVYKIYRFHINGFILNMLTGPNAGDIFDFDGRLFIEEGVLLLAFLVVCIGLWYLARRWSISWNARHIKISVCCLVVSLIVANGCYVYGSFKVSPSVMQSTQLIPYYFPLSASTFLERTVGLKRDAYIVDGGVTGEGMLNYPKHGLNAEEVETPPNILLILIDSWSKCSLTEECMPNIWRFAQEEQWYQNHISSSNGTANGVFGLFTGIAPYYWRAFETNHVSPLLVDRLLECGYNFKVYPSASIESPPFNRVLFQNVPNLRTRTEGTSSFERDMKIKNDFLADLPKLKQSGKPFFSFVFFDLLHAYSLPKELLNRFQPSWEYGDFAKLNNDMDPTPFWNLYRNSAYQTDKMIIELIEALKRLELYDNTIVFITGDHAQEYNENHKNYWGHSSNFSTYQIGVPLIIHEPGKQSMAYKYRTTHYDIVPTLMHNYLGVKNPLDDYTMGNLLNDSTPRLWHFVGNELRYAFIVEGDTILTKEGAGWINVTDAQLNPVSNYRLKPKDFDVAIRRLNSFFSK